MHLLINLMRIINNSELESHDRENSACRLLDTFFVVYDTVKQQGRRL